MSYNKNDPNQNWLSGYLGQIADEFGLQNWTLHLDSESIENSVMAVNLAFGRCSAVFKVGPAFWDSSPEEQRQTVIHELLHCHFAQVKHWCEQQMKCRIYDAFTLMNENAVDGLADAIAGKFPLPSRPE